MRTHLNILKPILLAGLALALNSCTVEKRVYSSGYHIEWHKNKHRISPPSPVEDRQISQDKSSDTTAIVSNSLQHTTQLITAHAPLTASSDKWMALDMKKAAPAKQQMLPNRKASEVKENKIFNARKYADQEPPAQTEDQSKKQKSLLSTLWTFVTLNYLYCDLVGLMDATKLSQYLVGTVDGLVMSQGFLLAAAVFMEIPMIMILLSRVLKGKGNRNANIIAGIIMTVVQLSTLFLGPVSVYYLFFSIVEIATTAFIVWYAWKKFPKPAKV